MDRWTCPACEREFARGHQAHTCVPGGTVDESFAGRSPVQREIYEAIMAHLATLGPVHADAVRVGVFLKSDRKFAEARPRARGLSLGLFLPRPVRSPRITRALTPIGDRVVHFLTLTRVEDVDDELREWLSLAYDVATG